MKHFQAIADFAFLSTFAMYAFTVGPWHTASGFACAVAAIVSLGYWVTHCPKDDPMVKVSASFKVDRKPRV